MLGNTLTLPVTGGDIVMIKVNQDKYSSEYMFRNTVHEYRARIRHTKTTATNGQVSYDRHNFEVVQTVFATSTVPEFHRKFYYVIEQLPSDTSKEPSEACCDFSVATSSAFLVSLLGWES